MNNKQLIQFPFDPTVEMYSNSNSDWNENKKKNSNTFRQQAVENVSAPAALSSASQGASHPGVKKDQGIPGRGYRKLSTEDWYTEINIQINNIRSEGRFNRVTVYVSIKEENDARYSIFLRGAATTSMSELRRVAKDDKAVLDVINTFNTEHPGCMIGRLLYKAPRGVKMADMHRSALRHAMIAIYEKDDELEAELYLLGEWYTIRLDAEISKKQQDVFFKAGVWRRDLEQFTGDDELA